MRFLRMLLLAALLPVSAGAAQLTGKVVRIIDGDTFVLLVQSSDGTKRQERVRIATIDSPEETQAFHRVAKDHLGTLIHEQTVAIDSKRKDIHGRTVGKVTLHGADIGLAQIRAGLAWYSRAYASALSLEDQGYYLSAEGSARREKAGLWADAHPTPPWAFRKVHKREPREALVSLRKDSP